MNCKEWKDKNRDKVRVHYLRQYYYKKEVRRLNRITI